jgi:uncharacterized membrane protein
MPQDERLSKFKRRLLIFPPLLISAVCLPMALGLIAPNRLYGFRTPASLASAEAWYQSNFSAGIAGVVLGIAGAYVNYRIVPIGHISTAKALVAAGVTMSVAFGSMIAGLLVS